MSTSDLPEPPPVPLIVRPSSDPSEPADGGEGSVSRLAVLFRTVFYLCGRDGVVLVSSISFSFLLSVFPFIVLLLTLVHYLKWGELQEIIFESLYYFFPVSQDFIIRNLKAYTQPIRSIHAYSLLLLVWGVSAFFFSLEAGLDSAYRVTQPRRFSVSQFRGSLMVVLFGVVALICVGILRMVRMLTKDLMELGERLAGGIETVSSVAISLFLTLLLFFMVYRYLPNRSDEDRSMLPEVISSALLWTAGNLIFRLLAPSWSLQKIYGPFFISVTLLLWAYAFGCILLGSARLSKDGFFGQPAPTEGPVESTLPIESGSTGGVEGEDDEESNAPGPVQ